MVTRYVVVLLLLAIAGVAHGDNPKLTAARQAIRDVRYDDARGLLVEAIDAGGNGPDELRELYQLSAATAVVLGQNELAEQYYRRVLALDPAAKLPADASPRLRPPFVAAQAYMAAHGRLDVRVTRRGRRIEIAVTADPLGMIAAVSAVVDGAVLPRIAVAGEPIAFEPTGTVERIALLDDHGNTLRAIPAPPEPIALASPANPRAQSTPLLRRWITWAIPAAVLAGTGVGFLISARRAENRLDEILGHGASYYLDDAEQQRTRWKTDATVADVLFVAAGAVTVTAIVMAVTREPSAPRTALAPIVGGRALGIALDSRF